MRKVQRLARSERGLDLVPHHLLTGVRQEVHDHIGLLGRLDDGEEGLSRDESVLDREIPASTSLTQADDDVQPMIPRVECLASALRSVPEHRECLPLEDILDFFLRVVRAFDHYLLASTEVEGLHP